MATTTIDLSSLNGSNGFRLDGVAGGSAGGSYDGDYSGSSVSSAGDINGDGFDDVIVGASGSDPNGGGSGASYVIFGKASGFGVSLNLSSLDGNNGFRLDGEAENDSLGYSASTAGDINGDGFDDLIIGTSHADPNGNYSGSSYVVFGKASGFDATLELSSLDGNNGFRLDGLAENDFLGESVSTAGDVNGDGFDDLIVGAPWVNFSYVVFGKASGFDASLNLSRLDGTNGFRLDGGNSSGSAVSNAGDVNDDGFDDLIIGAPEFDSSGGFYYKSGNTYVVFGKASGFDASLNLSGLDGNNGFQLNGRNTYDFSGESVSNAGDVNGDGFDDVIIGASGADQRGYDYSSGCSFVVFGKDSGFDASLDLFSLNGSNGFRLDGEDEFDDLGTSVSGAGDVNGDGYDDLIVGAPGADPNGIRDVGSSYIVFGKASGFDASLDLSSLNSTNGFRLDGEAEFDDSGSSVSDAGDVNGDGFDDVIVGAPHADPNGEDSGSSYIIFGRSDFGGSNVIEGAPGNDTLKGTPGADIFKARDGNDTLIGRGGADVFHGDAGDDQIKVADLSFGSVDGGTGNDVLHTDGKDLNLDLSFLSDKIQSIETICLYGSGDNTLTLTAEDLINLSDTTNVLKLHGNTGDRVILEDEWIDQGSHGFYHTYTQDDAVLLVGQNMATEFA